MPGWLTRAALYVWYADRWHWTPAQVDRLPLRLALDMRLAALALDAGRRRREEREQRQAERDARGGR